jgi:hypothetical protein
MYSATCSGCWQRATASATWSSPTGLVRSSNLRSLKVTEQVDAPTETFGVGHVLLRLLILEVPSLAVPCFALELGGGPHCTSLAAIRRPMTLRALRSRWRSPSSTGLEGRLRGVPTPHRPHGCGQLGGAEADRGASHPWWGRGRWHEGSIRWLLQPRHRGPQGHPGHGRRLLRGSGRPSAFAPHNHGDAAVLPNLIDLCLPR